MTCVFLPLQLLAAHLVGDFFFQPKAWVKSRRQEKLRSPALYLHAVLIALLGWVFTGFAFWQVPVVLFISHFVIDLWKAYQPDTFLAFVTDQALHFLVISLLWIGLEPCTSIILADLAFKWNTPYNWAFLVAVVMLTQPASVFLEVVTRQWRNAIKNEDKNLVNAGKWIGIMERLLVFTMVFLNQFAAIGLLTAAKSILRFGETKESEKRSEYVLVGTLISIGIAIFTGLVIRLLK